MFVLVTGVAVLISTGILDTDPPIELEVTTEQQARWVEGGTLNLSAWPKLSNNTDEGMALSADSRCHVFRWVLLTPGDAFVQAENEQGCSDVKVQQWLPAKTSQSDEFTLVLDPKRVKPGDYNLAVRYWGEETVVPVTIE